MSARAIIDETLRLSGWGNLDDLETAKWLDVQPDFRTSHYLDGFAHADKKFHFKVDWPNVPAPRKVDWGTAHLPPSLPGHWDVNEKTDAAHPFKLATSPSRGYLNSTFNELPSSQKREGKPRAKIHPEDMAALGFADGQRIRMGNARGEIVLAAESYAGVLRGVVIVESIQPNDAFADGCGINTLTSAHQSAPFGGTAYHDNHIWIRKE